MTADQRPVWFLATVRSRFHKAAPYEIRLGPVTGRGRTVKEGETDLTDNVLRALSLADTVPAFARDDDGSLIVAVQGLGAVVHWQIPADGSPVRSITFTDGPPRESLEKVPHYTVLGTYP